MESHYNFVWHRGEVDMHDDVAQQQPDEREPQLLHSIVAAVSSLFFLLLCRYVRPGFRGIAAGLLAACLSATEQTLTYNSICTQLST